MGTLVKQNLTSHLPSSPSPCDVYHVTLMPCFDKKLEASRADFFHSDGHGEYREVDCVLTPIELLDLWDEMKIDFASLPEESIDTHFSNFDEKSEMFYGNGGGSGGYAEMIYKAFAKRKFNQEISVVPFKSHRNSDFQVLVLFPF